MSEPCFNLDETLTAYPPDVQARALAAWQAGNLKQPGRGAIEAIKALRALGYDTRKDGPPPTGAAGLIPRLHARKRAA